MKLNALLLGATLASAAPSLDLRALPNAPDEYAPANVSCPAVKPTVRTASKLSQNETDWLESRRKEVVSPLKSLLGRLNLTNFDASAYIDRVSTNTSNLPNVGIAVSGGGYRAMLNGAGALKAFDSRTTNSTASGQLGGLLQSATYLSALSGGGWLVGSVFINNFTTISDLQTSENTWDLRNNILEGPDVKHFQFFKTVDYWSELVDTVKTKKEAGFNTSLTDYWGRALSYQFINASNGGPDYTWSSIALMENFQRGQTPLPILVADGRNPGELVVGSNSTVYEFNPWEFGTFDPAIYSFAPLEYLGSDFKGGQISSNGSCVRGFDNAGYIMGTSSSLFNQGLLRLNGTKIPKIFKSAIASILEDLGQDNNDIANYPNPFYQYTDTTPNIASRTHLSVVDGGEDGQNVPLHPLIQPERNVDVIFAVDSTSNIHGWPSGKSLVRTYERSLSSTVSNGTAFPAVPDPNTFINLGLNKRPTFFGCDSKNLTGPAPLIVYLPNAPYTYLSNTSTFDLSYSYEDRDDMITNGYNVVTQGNGTEDANWPSCVGCAILSRSAERTKTTLPEVCTKCFKNYCWDGTINSTEPENYEPQLMIKTNLAPRELPVSIAAIFPFALALAMML
ncbi:lysophospholipase catalytic domain-containing protein [Aspergillus caelatus]|uniref:Lysophospholipase n=1 Tax=Aspergillus caelatus TaxID=61420 RepID=A0A5N7A2G2_9EURO|nr:lysophospholipase catalytic domain-containing protein [Aspergillus caelatus]KAE8364022.1 lysophospholipase catalytic domain-containing protein [Aspergillus caelatus]